jgi:hypothetical protein
MECPILTLALLHLPPYLYLYLSARYVHLSPSPATELIPSDPTLLWIWSIF